MEGEVLAWGVNGVEVGGMETSAGPLTPQPSTQTNPSCYLKNKTKTSPYFQETASEIL